MILQTSYWSANVINFIMDQIIEKVHFQMKGPGMIGLPFDNIKMF